MHTKIFFFVFSFSKAAVLIQAQWRSYVARRQINFSAETHPTTTEPLHNPFTNNQTTSNEERRKNIMNIQELREKAALHIQVNFKLLIAELVINFFLLIFHSVILYFKKVQ